MRERACGQRCKLNVKDGDGNGNRRTIGIEICYSTGDQDKFQKAEENAALYIAHVLKQYGWGLGQVYKHQDWSGKYCPHQTLDKGWDRFEAMIQANLDQLNGGGATTQAPDGHPIISEPTATIQQMQDWARGKGATQTFIDLAPIFYDVAHVKGVDPAGVYAQSAKETWYGKFGGVLDESYKNPCGLKTTEGGGDYDANAHQRFESWEQGITAQVDHLLLYAGQPQEPTPDPRHFAWIAGKAKTWEALGGNWAPSATYGTEIVKMMQDIANTPKRESKPKEPASAIPEWALDDYNKAIEMGITTGERPNDPATRLEVALMIIRALNIVRALNRPKQCPMQYPSKHF